MRKIKDNETPILVVMCAILGWCAYTVYQQDRPVPLNDPPSLQFLPPEEPKEHHDPVPDKVSELQAKIDKLNKRVKLGEDRIDLLGTLHNECWTIESRNIDRGQLIFINRDWTINGMPKYLLMTPEDKAKLEKLVK